MNNIENILVSLVRVIFSGGQRLKNPRFHPRNLRSIYQGGGSKDSTIKK